MATKTYDLDALRGSAASLDAVAGDYEAALDEVNPRRPAGAFDELNDALWEFAERWSKNGSDNIDLMRSLALGMRASADFYEGIDSSRAACLKE